MAEMPMCKKCDRPHWRFNPCESVAATPVIPTPKPRPVTRQFSVPPGYVEVAPGKFAKAPAGASLVQIAPGRYRKVN